MRIEPGASGDNIVVYGNIIPAETLTYSLGSTGERWKEVYIGPGSINLGGPPGSDTEASIGMDATGLVYTEFGFASPFLAIGASTVFPLTTGGWLIGSTGDPTDYATYDLIATQIKTDSPGTTGPAYSLIRSRGITGATGSAGNTGLNGDAGSTGVTGSQGSTGSTGTNGIGVTGTTGLSILGQTGSTGPLNTEVMTLTSEPTGHAVRTDSQISFDPTTRVFTIQPTTTSFDVWVAGSNYTKTTAETTTLAASSDLYYIAYNPDGSLINQTSFFIWDQQAPTAYIYFNTGATGEYMLFDERHGVTMDWATHEYLHRTRGAQIANGFALNNFTTTGTGNLNSDAQVSVQNGTFFDEDLQVDITDGTPGTGEWVQQLQSPARVPVIYLNGGAWRKTAVSDYALYIDSGDTRPAYNSVSSGIGTLVEVNNNHHVVYYLAATNMVTTPIISIMGQASYSSLSKAQDASWNELYLQDLPIVEIRPLWRLIFEARNSYTNDVNSRLVDVSDLRGISVITGTGVGAEGPQGVTGATGSAAISHTYVSSFTASTNVGITGTSVVSAGPYSLTSNAFINFSAFAGSTGVSDNNMTFTISSNSVSIPNTTNIISLSENKYANISLCYLDSNVSGSRTYSVSAIGTSAGFVCNANLVVNYL